MVSDESLAPALLILRWVMVAVGAALILLAPFTVTGWVLIAVGAAIMAAGVAPILQRRRAKRLAELRQGGLTSNE